MIISYKHQYIFIKTNKTAGTSVEIALSQFCGPDDIITPISKRDEVKRREWGGKGPQNCYSPFREYMLADVLRLLFTFKRKLKYFNHMKALDVRKTISTDTWSTFYKFCIVRNPWDRFISFYYWQNRKHPRPSKLEFMKCKRMNIFFERGFKAYTDGDCVIVDELIKYEELQPALMELLKNIGIQEFRGLPTTKHSTRKRQDGYREEFNIHEAELLKKLVSDELDVTKYHY